MKSLKASLITMVTVSVLLQKGVCPYEYMDDWKKFNVTSYLKNKIFTVTEI